MHVQEERILFDRILNDTRLPKVWDLGNSFLVVTKTLKSVEDIFDLCSFEDLRHS